MGVLQALEAIDAQYRGRPGEEHDWPLLFWAGVSQRIEAHRQAEAWSRCQSAQQVVLDWITARQADAAQLQADWTAQEGQERQVWGVPDTDVYRPLHARLTQGLQALQAFERDVKAGTFQPALARLQVWTSMTKRPARPPAQPHEQLQAWLDDTTRVVHRLQEP